MDINSKLSHVGTTIFTIMSQMAADHNAINLSQGYPDFDVPGPLLDLVEKYLRDGYNQYPPMTGVPYLREQIARKVKLLYDVELDANSEVTVTSGATEAIFVAIQTVVNPGDEVIVFDPAYDSYDPSVVLAGGRTIHLPLRYPGFQIDFERLRDSINAKTKLIIVNSPHNPCGSILPPEALDHLAELVRDTDIALVSDEVYEHMVYDGETHQTLLGHPELRSRSFVVSSFGKTYHATGWKVASCAAPRKFTDEFRKVHQFVTFTTHTPTQWALAEFMETYPEHYFELPAFYQAKRDLFLQEMSDSDFSMEPSPGTYFQLADYSNISNMVDTEFVKHLTCHIGVAAIPISVFYESPPEFSIVRFCFAKDDDTLRTATAKLCNMAPISVK